MPAKNPQVYDINFYQKHVKYSCLARELNQKFTKDPLEAFDAEGNLDPDWDNPSSFQEHRRQYSCMFSPGAATDAG